MRSCVARSCDAYHEVTMRSTMRSAMLHRIVTSRLRIAKHYFAKRFRNASWTFRMRTEDNLLRERFEQKTKITQERKVGIIRFSRSQVTIEHGLICSFRSNLSYCGFEMSNFKENKPNWKLIVAGCVRRLQSRSHSDRGLATVPGRAY